MQSISTVRLETVLLTGLSPERRWTSAQGLLWREEAVPYQIEIIRTTQTTRLKYVTISIILIHYELGLTGIEVNRLETH